MLLRLIVEGRSEPRAQGSHHDQHTTSMELCERKDSS